MSTKKELHQLYGGRKPKSYLPAHNHIAHVPGTGHGERGFRRFWIPPQWAGRDFVKCPCGWRAPSWDKDAPHYAIRCHVKHWRDLIKKEGSLEAAHKAEIRKIWRGYDPELRRTLRLMAVNQERMERAL
jgi:hypothetical protein